jgi:pyruvate,orthophosphate dikinase
VTFTYPLDAVHPGTLDDAKALVGGKAANLGVMARDLGLPVPPGFVITTETCRTFLATGWPNGLDDEIRERMSAVGAAVGRRFGDPADPLLVSVRSGAPISMPGMMDTILDLGMNDATEAGLARASGSAAFARACHDRLAAGFRSIVGVDVLPDDPWTQLRLAIEAVFRSWQSPRAIAYRQREGIPDDLGTAVTVQAMVFGNRGADSGTGVVFTRNPATGEATLYGDVLFDAQGEDVVAGTHHTEPIAILDTRLPAVAAELRTAADRLERHYADMCDIEFTIEDARLWMLQVRTGKRSPAAALRIAVDMAEDPDFPLTRAAAVERVLRLLADPPSIATARSSFVLPLLTGLAASPGVGSGPLVTTPEAAQAAADEGTPAILVRAETSPDDVHGMARAAGILTSRGGLASHAAVVARGWGIPAVVGATALDVRSDGIVVGDRTLPIGTELTIDGASGEVFEGTIPGSAVPVPEAATLLGWAAELGIEIPTPATETADAPDATASPASGVGAGPVTLDRCLRVVGTKGFAMLPGLADALLSTPDAVQPVVDQLVVDGLLATTAGAYRLSESGSARATQLLATDRASWGEAAASAALDAFVALDHRMKDTVTAWQLRDPVAQVLNDHSDPDYDRTVLDRLAALHADASAWLEPIVSRCPRLDDYPERLDRALAAAEAGDARFVASPRVDSYHGIWFELHEDLIGLAGRSRADEVAAGRA